MTPYWKPRYKICWTIQNKVKKRRMHWFGRLQKQEDSR